MEEFPDRDKLESMYNESDSERHETHKLEDFSEQIKETFRPYQGTELLIPVATYVNYEEELARAQEIITENKTYIRPLRIVGRLGSGKTEFVKKLLSEIFASTELFKDGVIWVDFSTFLKSNLRHVRSRLMGKLNKEIISLISESPRLRELDSHDVFKLLNTKSAVIIIDNIPEEDIETVYDWFRSESESLFILIVDKSDNSSNELQFDKSTDITLDGFDWTGRLTLLAKFISFGRILQETKYVELVLNEIGNLPFDLELVGKLFKYLEVLKFEDILNYTNQHHIGGRTALVDFIYTNLPETQKDLLKRLFKLFDSNWFSIADLKQKLDVNYLPKKEFQQIIIAFSRLKALGLLQVNDEKIRMNSVITQYLVKHPIIDKTQDLLDEISELNRNLDNYSQHDKERLLYLRAKSMTVADRLLSSSQQTPSANVASGSPYSETVSETKTIYEELMGLLLIHVKTSLKASFESKEFPKILKLYIRILENQSDYKRLSEIFRFISILLFEKGNLHNLESNLDQAISWADASEDTAQVNLTRLLIIGIILKFKNSDKFKNSKIDIHKIAGMAGSYGLELENLIDSFISLIDQLEYRSNSSIENLEEAERIVYLFFPEIGINLYSGHVRYMMKQVITDYFNGE